MKKITLFVLGCLIFSVQLSYAEKVYHPNGWVYPMDKYPKAKEWDSWHSYTGHVGHDYMQDAGKPVRATADGRIADYDNSLSKYGGPNDSNKGGAILLLHETLDETVFYSVYGHSYIKSGLRIGSNVQAGDIIGYTHEYIGEDHIHFGIRPHSIDSTHPFRGICYSSNDCGWVDPAVFLDKHYPGSPFYRNVVGQGTYSNVSIYWKPANVSCINANAWCYDGTCSANHTNSVCYDAYDELKDIDIYKYIQQKWHDTFFGNQDEFDDAQSECSAD